MSNQVVRWGILGCAGIAATAMIPGIQASRNGEVLAVSSRNREKAEEYRRRFGISKSYGSYQELLEDPEVDAVYIPLPNSLHEQWTINAAGMGKHVLCEKPIACNAAEAREMSEICRRNNVLLMEAFAHRFHPQYERTMQLIREGRIGEILRISAAMSRSSYPVDNIRMNRSLCGGALFDLGCYCVNTARLLVGTEPIRVYAVQEIGSTGVDERTTATVHFPGRIVLQFDTNLFLSDGHFEQGCTVYGERGNIYIPRAFTQIELLRFAKMVESGLFISDHTIGKGHTEEISMGAVHQWCLEAEYFAGRILSGDPIDLPAEDGVANMKVIDALVRSTREGKSVDL